MKHITERCDSGVCPSLRACGAERGVGIAVITAGLGLTFSKQEVVSTPCLTRSLPICQRKGVDITMLTSELERAVKPWRLLSHPFYARWSAGDVSVEELQAYAGQYRCFEKALPEMLWDIAKQTANESAREFILRNYADEIGGDGRSSHLTLFDQFVAGLGSSPSIELMPAMENLLSSLCESVQESSAAGLAALIAYEMQAPEVATSKAMGLRQHYGLDDAAVAFWDVHGTLDESHTEWAIEALARITDDVNVVTTAATGAARAWWTFLDEREALRPVGVTS